MESSRRFATRTSRVGLPAVLSIAAACASDGGPTQDKIGSAQVSILSVATWDAYMNGLQPRFELSADEALAKVIPSVMRSDDRILDTLGPRWKRALAATVGRWTFDYLTLMAALAAIGSHPRPGLVLLAFCGAQLLAQIPITPGGLGFVEAGLIGMLTLAGVAAGAAAVATLAYRLVSFWIPIPAGGVAWLLYRRRYP